MFQEGRADASSAVKVPHQWAWKEQWQAFPGGSDGKALILLFRRLAGSNPTWGGRLVADARDQQPFEPGEWGLESCSLRAFLREPPCRTCKKHQAGI